MSNIEFWERWGGGGGRWTFTYSYCMICYEEFENPCTFVLKLLMQHVSPTGKKKREGGGKKTVYLFTTVKRQKTPNS